MEKVKKENRPDGKLKQEPNNEFRKDVYVAKEIERYGYVFA